MNAAKKGIAEADLGTEIAAYRREKKKSVLKVVLDTNVLSYKKRSRGAPFFVWFTSSTYSACF